VPTANFVPWGEDFRKDYAKVGDNIVGKCVGKPCIVVTATAAGEDRRRLSGDLRLLKPEVVVGDPNRPNILYEIRKRPPSTEVEDHVKEVFTPIAEQLKDQKLSFPQTILYTDTFIRDSRECDLKFVHLFVNIC